jgi:hypothetical protein
MISHALFVTCRCRNGQTYHENKSSQLQHIVDAVHHTQTSGAGGHSSLSKLFVKLQSPLQDWVAYSIILQLCRSVVYTLKWDIEAEILAAWPNFSSPQSIAVELKLAGIAVFEWVLQLDLQEFNCSVWGSTAPLFWICRDFLKNPRSDTAIQPSLKTIYHQKTCIFYLANLWSCSLKCLCRPGPISTWTVSWCACDNSRSTFMNWIHFVVVIKSTKTPWLHTAWHESLTSSLAMDTNHSQAL